MAGFFGIGDFTKEGKGVEKDAPKKRGIFAFFELFFRKFGRLCKLNMLYLLACVPTAVVVFIVAGVVSSTIINSSTEVLAQAMGLAAPDMENADFVKSIAIVDVVIRGMITLLFTALWGMGPVTAGFTYILRNYSREEHAWLWSDFWQYTKENFKQSIVIWLVDLVAMPMMFIAYMFYSRSQGVIMYFKYIMCVLIFVYTSMHFYIYPMMVTFKLSVKDLYRNSLLFAFGKLPINIFVFAVLLFIHVGIPYIGLMRTGGAVTIYWLAYALLELVIFLSMSGFIVNFSVYPTLKKYMIIDTKKQIKSETEV